MSFHESPQEINEVVALMKYVLCLVLTLCVVCAARGALAAVAVWETPRAVSDDADVAGRESWRAVAAERLEAGYAFSGDAVVESADVTAVFSRRKASVVFLVGRQALMRVTPGLAQPMAGAAGLTVRGMREGVGLRLAFEHAGERGGLSYCFREGLVQVDASGVEAVDVRGAFAYALVPSFIGDDLIYDPRRSGGLEELHVPAENVLVGLVAGEEGLVTACWPPGEQRVALGVGASASAGKQFGRMRIAVAGQPLFLGLTHHRGVWHRQAVDLDSYERPCATGWTRPFAAGWITQFGQGNYAASRWREARALLEYDGIVSTFAFADNAAKRTWKATVGWHEWPCWFEAGSAYVRIGKKVKPAGEDLLFYFLERRQGTPPEVKAPVDVVREALADAEGLLDSAGRKKRPLNRAGSVYNQPTCGTTAALAEVFKRGDEVREASRVVAVAGDLAWYYDNMARRLDDFAAFASGLRALCESVTADHPVVGSFIEDLEIERRLAEIDSAVNLSGLGAGMRPSEAVLGDLVALTEAHSETSLAHYLALRSEIIRRGGILDNSAAQADFVVRGLAQKAGYRCVDAPSKVRFAEALRRLAREHLRNPTPWEQGR